ncbi:DNA gyrase inhibitor [Enterococcus casseliflavus]|nr:DNA gyrase inhibitor [Enterococcus casseliflavus]
MRNDWPIFSIYFGRKIMEFNIENIESCHIVYVQNVGAYGSAENFQLMENFKKWIVSNKLEDKKNAKGIIAIAQDDPQTTLSAKCRYELLLFTDQDFSDDSYVKTGNFKGGKYAVFTITHTSEAIQLFWKNINATIDKNQLEVLASPILERYREEVGPDKTCEFLVPIK